MYNSYSIRPYKKGEEKYVADKHRNVYLEEYNWGPVFGNYAASVACNFALTQRKSREELWVAEIQGTLAGCIMLSEAENPEIGQLRLFLVDKKYRKNGVGTALTSALMNKARVCNYKKLVLWTADVLIEARQHYSTMGFTCVESISNDVWNLSGKTIYEEKWEMNI
ncbi:MAG: GNAT family N-acetyltransferase [Megasphaera sp.]|jgi:N-acetylglutamate synthase-like GNAT family acetyltransferase|uniref:GNAT family N-acetyltransferase n=1 Tax=Megasphaera sueciensis TaxID=349094 RepID=UPI003D042A15|nr:GNAT family N-acetyltransferase [Megasphaera sp.]